MSLVRFGLTLSVHLLLVRPYSGMGDTKSALAASSFALSCHKESRVSEMP